MFTSKLLARLFSVIGLHFSFVVDPNTGGGGTDSDTDADASSSAPDAQQDEGADDSKDEGGNAPEDTTQSKPGDAAKTGDKTLSKLQRRIDRRTHALGQRDQIIAQQAEELARLRGRQTNDAQENDDDRKPAANIDPHALAQEIARDTLYRQEIASKTTAMLEKGRAVNPRFKELVIEVADEIPFVVGPRGQERPSPFIEAVLACNHSHEILLHLQANSDELAELADMPQRQRERKIIELDLTFRKPASRRSNAPKPLELLQGGKGGGVRNEDQLSDAEWREQRNKQRGSKS